MKNKIEFNIDEIFIRKFKSALMLSGDNENELLEKWIKEYNQSVFLKEISPETSTIDFVEEKKEEEIHNPLINKIRKWAEKTSTPHKIIKVFLLAYDETAKCANRNRMRELYCMDENETPKRFNDNLAQMMSKGKNAHGKVFDLYGENIYLVEEIADEVFALKEKFIK